MAIPPQGISQLRKGRVSLVGQVYFITKTTVQRLAENAPPGDGILLNSGIAETLKQSLELLEAEKVLEVCAYVIMPDHLHLLMKLGGKHNLSQTMQHIFGYTSFAINKKLELQGKQKLKFGRRAIMTGQ